MSSSQFLLHQFERKLTQKPLKTFALSRKHRTKVLLII
uniref:Uncharacterized protein n=1 Tax=Anguilla anguilla TaxID=7936 RepID=A0A0E9TI58_ANGAN